MLRLCICLLALYFIGCQCPRLEKEHIVKENPVNMGTEALSPVVHVGVDSKPTTPTVSMSTEAPSPVVHVKVTPPANIEWITTFDEGLKMAKSRNCPLMVDFYAEWCGWCKKLDKETWTDKNVIQLAQRFVCVKIDCDTDRQTPARYGARSLPTILFINSDGKVIHQVIGYRNSEDMITEMNKAGQ